MQYRSIIMLLFLCLVAGMAVSQEKTRVLKLNIDAEIDPRMSRYVELGLSAAKTGNYDLVVIEMDTYGGLVTDAKDIVEMLLDFDKPIYDFINKDAASAGALISIACDSIFMAPGASIGAATVVMGQGEAAPDKYQSYMRSTMRSTAEEKGRDPAIAEAMVDENIEIKGVTEKGSVITFTTAEAMKFGFCEGEVKSVDELLEKTGVTSYTIDTFTLSWVDRIIAFFLNPVLSGVLILIIIGGIYFELQTPGVGFPLLASITAAILYFIPYYLSGLAANWELVVFMVGIILIGLEVFVIPGFGVAGISGIIMVVGSMILVMLGNDVFDFSLVPMKQILIATMTTMSGLLGSLLLMFFGGVQLTRTKLFERVALSAVQKKDEGFTATFNPRSMVGKIGSAYTVLRPSGKVMIDSDVYDAFTRGEYIQRDESVEVISEEGTTLQVKKHVKQKTP